MAVPFPRRESGLPSASPRGKGAATRRLESRLDLGGYSPYWFLNVSFGNDKEKVLRTKEHYKFLL